jgi:large subunit ribosomal protein L4
MEAKIYNQKGKSVGTVALPENVFGAKWNADLVHQVVTAEAANARTPVAHTKTRGEVRGGGKKPWKQKGTGRARHGSTRSPIWVGGGITFGPRNDKVYAQKINKKMKVGALYSVLSAKLKMGEVIFVDDFAIADAKTKGAKEILTTLGTLENCQDLATKRKNAALIALGAKNKNIEKSFNNIKSVEIGELRNITPSLALKYKYIIISKPEESVKFIADKMN